MAIYVKVPDYKFKFEVRSDLRRFKKMNGYQANAVSQFALIKHLRFKFGFSEFELNQAVREHKIRIITLQVVEYSKRIKEGETHIYESSIDVSNSQS